MGEIKVIRYIGPGCKLPCLAVVQNSMGGRHLSSGVADGEFRNSQTHVIIDVAWQQVGKQSLVWADIHACFTITH